MSAKVRQAVILAAGKGTRLHPLSTEQPKPLQPVCNKPIMQYQLEILRAAAIDEVAIVVGPGGGPMRTRFGDGHQLGLRLEYIEDQAPAGIASSLARAESWVRGPFVVFLGDIFVAVKDFSRAIEPLEDGAAGTVAVLQDTPEAVRKNFAVVVDQFGRVERVIEKPERPTTDLKGCGVYAFRKDIFDALRRTPRSSIRNEYEITDALQLYIEMGDPVYAVEVVRWDVNVTYPRDLLGCNLRMLLEMGLDRLIGVEARVSEHVHLARSVVGERAVVDARVTLEDSLVLPEARVSGLSGILRRQIFADGYAISVGSAATSV